MRQQSAPISRGLARIIRDSSRLATEDAPLSEHLKTIEERQGATVELYLSACALRLRGGT